MGVTAPNPFDQLGQQPSQLTTPDMGRMPSSFLHKNEEGVRAPNIQEMKELESAGWQKCPNPKCNFMINPASLEQIKSSNGYFMCPACKQSYDLMADHLPYHGAYHGSMDPSQFAPGGTTRIGIPLADQGQIGENIVAKMGEIPGYGPITWWHGGGANVNSPLDGATKEWGIEVKTYAMDNKHWRFIPGHPSEKSDKNNQAAQMGLKGVLGITVMLDYRRDLADVYVKEMPLEQGVHTYRMSTKGVGKLATEVPFDSPYKDPNNPSPMPHSEHGYNMEEYYQQPDIYDPTGNSQPEDNEIPF